MVAAAVAAGEQQGSSSRRRRCHSRKNKSTLNDLRRQMRRITTHHFRRRAVMMMMTTTEGTMAADWQWPCDAVSNTHTHAHAHTHTPSAHSRVSGFPRTFTRASVSLLAGPLVLLGWNTLACSMSLGASPGTSPHALAQAASSWSPLCVHNATVEHDPRQPPQPQHSTTVYVDTSKGESASDPAGQREYLSTIKIN